MTLVGSLVRPLASVDTRRRWVFMVFGGAILVPYGVLVVPPLVLAVDRKDALGALVAAGLVVLGLAAIAVTSTLDAVRQVEVVAAKQLLRGPLAGELVPVSAGPSDRARAATFFAVHLVGGGVVGAATLIVVPLGFGFLLAAAGLMSAEGIGGVSGRPAMGVAGLACLLGFAYGVALLGGVMSRLAPRLLGRSSAARLAEMERLTEDLSERNRIARDLHDSIGHALSIVTVQAGAARRVLDRDTDFARESLHSVEDVARQALEELDGALAVLRDDGEPGRRRTLREINTLVHQSEAAGIVVRAELRGPIDELPEPLSRDAFLVVQESLTNVLRHAGPVEVALRIVVDHDAVRLEVSNRVPTLASRSRPSGGRGVRVMAERVRALGGDIEVGVAGDRWRVAARLPLGRHP